MEKGALRAQGIPNGQAEPRFAPRDRVCGEERPRAPARQFSGGPILTTVRCDPLQGRRTVEAKGVSLSAGDPPSSSNLLGNTELVLDRRAPRARPRGLPKAGRVGAGWGPYATRGPEDEKLCSQSAGCPTVGHLGPSTVHERLAVDLAGRPAWFHVKHASPTLGCLPTVRPFSVDLDASLESPGRPETDHHTVPGRRHERPRLTGRSARFSRAARNERPSLSEAPKLNWKAPKDVRCGLAALPPTTAPLGSRPPPPARLLVLVTRPDHA